MERVIEIEGRPERFKSTALSLIIYKSQFSRDLLLDLSEIVKMRDGLVSDDICDFDIALFMEILWALRKTADENTPDVYDWLDTFEGVSSFIDAGAIIKVLGLITDSMRGSKVNKDGGKSGDIMTTELFTYLCRHTGLSYDDMSRMTIGMCLDYIDEYIRQHNYQGNKNTVREATTQDMLNF